MLRRVSSHKRRAAELAVGAVARAEHAQRRRQARWRLAHVGAGVWEMVWERFQEQHQQVPVNPNRGLAECEHHVARAVPRRGLGTWLLVRRCGMTVQTVSYCMFEDCGGRGGTPHQKLIASAANQLLACGFVVMFFFVLRFAALPPPGLAPGPSVSTIQVFHFKVIGQREQILQNYDDLKLRCM